MTLYVCRSKLGKDILELYLLEVLERDPCDLEY